MSSLVFMSLGTDGPCVAIATKAASCPSFKVFVNPAAPSPLDVLVYYEQYQR